MDTEEVETYDPHALVVSHMHITRIMVLVKSRRPVVWMRAGDEKQTCNKYGRGLASHQLSDSL